MDHQVLRIDITEPLAIEVDGQTRWIGHARFPRTPRPRRLLVLTVGEELVAVPATCPHERAELTHARLVNGHGLVCPAHQATHDLREGQLPVYRVDRDGDGLAVLWEPVSSTPVPPRFLSGGEGDEKVAVLEREVAALTEAAEMRQRQVMKTLEQMEGMIQEVEGQRAQFEVANRRLGSINEFVNRVMDTMTEGLAVFDLAGKVVEVNHRLAGLLGRPRDEVKALTVDEVLPGPALAAVRGQVRSSQALATDEENELTLTTGAGASVEVLVRTAALYGAAGKKEGTVVVATDVRRIKAAQREVAQAFDKVATLLDGMRQAVFMVLDTGLIVEPVSRATREVLAQDVVGRNLFDVLYRDLDRAGEAFPLLQMAFAATFGADELQWEIMADHFPRRLLYRVESEPEPRILKVEYAPLRTDGVMDRLMLIIDDVTNVELLERERQSHERQTGILKELAGNGPASLRQFFAAAALQLEEVRRLVDQPGQEGHQALMRALHTLKGNARMLHLSLIGQATHEAETLWVDAREPDLPADARAQAVARFRAQLSTVQRQVVEYAQVAEALLNVPNEHERQAARQLHEAAGAVDRLLFQVPEGGEGPIVAQGLSALRSAAESLGADRLLGAVQAADRWLAAEPRGDAAKIRRELAGAAASALARTGWFELHALTPRGWARLMRAVLLLTREVRRCSGPGAAFDLACRRAVEQAQAEADELHHRFALALLGQFEAVFARPEVSAPLARGLLSTLWAHLALHSALEGTATLRDGEREALAAAVGDVGALAALVASGRLREQTLTRCLAELTADGLGPEALFAAAGWAWDVAPPVAAGAFVSSSPPGDVMERLHAVEVAGSAKDLALGLAGLGWAGPVAIDGEQGRFLFHGLLDVVRLVRTVGELVKGNFHLLFAPVPSVEVRSSRLSRLVDGLRALGATGVPGLDRLLDEAEHLLDVPVLPQLVRYRELVTDVSRRLGKKVELVLSGDAAVSLPPARLARIHDALVHLVRNGLDHGLEPPEERRARGKAEVGRLELGCEVKDGRVLLTVSDDGRGIDGDRVRASAVRKGLLEPATAATLDAQSCVDLILLPHFSTAATTTDISGRGIGMDVVVRSLADAGASLAIVTEVGGGTRFTITA